MFDDSKVSYEIEVCQDDVEVRGNAMYSGNDDLDRKVEDTIIARLDEGDVWAWCIVKVIATYEGVGGVEGADYLGACNYADEEDFKTCGYYDDMKEEARCALYAELEEHVKSCGSYDNHKAHPELEGCDDQKPVEVIVIVRGGVVQNVYTDRPANVQIKNFDDDPDCALCTDGLEIGY
jgi:hypothetical protein